MRKTVLEAHYRRSMQEKGLQKAFIIREMRQFWKLEKLPQCKSYSLCKMVSLGEKIKWPKRCEKPFYKHIKDVLCRKRLQKTLNHSRNETILKIGKMATMQRL